MQDGKIGLDIGTSSMKFVEVKRGGERPLLIHFGIKDIIAGLTSDELGGEIRRLLASKGVSTKKVSTSLSGRSTIVRYVTFPKMSDRELESSLEFEADKYLPFDRKESIIDSQILKVDNSTNKMFVLLAAAKKTAINERMKVLRSAGLEAESIQLDPFSIINLFEAANLGDGKGVYAIADIGSARVHLSILKDRVPLLTREMDIKAEGRIPALVEEIQATLAYFENQSGIPAVRIYLTGGSSKINGLSDSLKEALKIEVVYWDPLTGIDIDTGAAEEGLAEVKDRLAVSLGLAIKI